MLPFMNESDGEYILFATDASIIILRVYWGRDCKRFLIHKPDATYTSVRRESCKKLLASVQPFHFAEIKFLCHNSLECLTMCNNRWVPLSGRCQFHIVFHGGFYDCKEHHLGCISCPEPLKCYSLSWLSSDSHCLTLFGWLVLYTGSCHF